MNLFEIKSLTQATNFCREDLLKCILGISDLDASVFCALRENDRSRRKSCKANPLKSSVLHAEDNVGNYLTVKEIAKEVNRDRSSVQRSLKNLIAVGLVSRKSQSAGRGMRYTYSSITKGSLKDMLLSRIDMYYSILKKMVEGME